MPTISLWTLVLMLHEMSLGSNIVLCNDKRQNSLVCHIVWTWWHWERNVNPRFISDNGRTAPTLPLLLLLLLPLAGNSMQLVLLGKLWTMYDVRRWGREMIDIYCIVVRCGCVVPLLVLSTCRTRQQHQHDTMSYYGTLHCTVLLHLAFNNLAVITQPAVSIGLSIRVGHFGAFLQITCFIFDRRSEVIVQM